MFNTGICEMLDIKYPIIQGGMAWIATAELAAAISEAGGMGIIGAGNAPAKIVEREIINLKKLTDKPFGVNIMLLSPFVEEIVDIVCGFKVPAVTTGAGNPARFIKELKGAGTKIIPVIPTVALAKRMENSGVDAVIAEGTEAGGHIGELTTMALIPQVADAVNIPVIAAGGIADGRGLLAALSLGAEGVQIGTRFICAEECTAHKNYKNMILKAKDRDAVVTARITGHPVRMLKNKLARQFLELEKKGVAPEKIEQLGQGRLELAAIEGDVENGSVMAGQIAGMVNKIQPCREIIEEIMLDAKNRLNSVSKLYVEV